MIRMTKTFYSPLIAVAALFAIGWFIQGHFRHTTGETLILRTTTDGDRKKIQSELMLIADHAAGIKLSSEKDDLSLSSLQKVSATPYFPDSSQIRDAKDLSTTWNTWKVRQLNTKLLSEPVHVFSPDTIP